MNSNVKNIILSIVLLLAFFMSWFKIMGLGGSGYDIIVQTYKNINFIGEEVVLSAVTLLIFPISALIILLHYIIDFKSSTNFNFLHFIKKLPAIYILLSLLFVIIETEGKIFDFIAESLQYVKPEDLFQYIGIGFILTLVSSILLFFDKNLPNISLKTEEKPTIEEDTH